MVLQLQLLLLTAVAGTSTRLLGESSPTLAPEPQGTTALATVSVEPGAALIGSPVNVEEAEGGGCREQVCGAPAPPFGPRPFAARAKGTESGRLARGAGKGEAARARQAGQGIGKHTGASSIGAAQLEDEGRTQEWADQVRKEELKEELSPSG